MQAVICPVCKGSGKYKKKECHGCDGKGWVSVGMDYPPSYTPPDRVPYDPNKWFVTWTDANTVSTLTEYDAGPYCGLSGGGV